jgi:hypothetical protein
MPAIAETQMLGRETLFIIGAGAGFDVNMPVGTRLATEIAEETNFRFKGGLLEGGNERVWAASRTMALAAGLDQTSTLIAGRMIATGITYAQSIDNYVRTHSDKEAVKIIAKNAIVHRILEAERNSSLFIDSQAAVFGRFKNEEEVGRSWLQAFFSILQDGVIEAYNIENIFDNLSIINFNYDRCIEHFLFQAIQRLYPAKGAGYLADLISRKLKIIHPYGVVGELEWQGSGPSIQFGAKDDSYDLAELSGGIRTYNEEVEDKKKINELHNLVSAAGRIVFLGFHFHKQNVELISPSLKSSHLPGAIEIYATHVERSPADKAFILSNRISRILHGRGVDQDSSAIADCDCTQLFKRFGTLLAG